MPPDGDTTELTIRQIVRSKRCLAGRRTATPSSARSRALLYAKRDEFANAARDQGIRTKIESSRQVDARPGAIVDSRAARRVRGKARGIGGRSPTSRNRHGPRAPGSASIKASETRRSPRAQRIQNRAMATTARIDAARRQATRGQSALARKECRPSLQTVAAGRGRQRRRSRRHTRHGAVSPRVCAPYDAERARNS